MPMTRSSPFPQTDDAGLLRYKYQRRERTVRAVASGMRLAALALVLVSIQLAVEAVATNAAAARAIRPGWMLIAPTEGPRGQYHRVMAARLLVTLSLATMFAIAGFGLPSFRIEFRRYAEALGILLFVLSTLAIVAAVTTLPPHDPDADTDPDEPPLSFYAGLVALGFGLPLSAALVGFLRNRLLDPLFTAEYRDAIRRSVPLPVRRGLIGAAVAVTLALAGLWIIQSARDAAARPPDSWLVPAPLFEADGSDRPVQPDAIPTTVSPSGRPTRDQAPSPSESTHEHPRG
ncbi:MAG: hypothetical protein KatS3mg108_1455 [Isosphaeraceae bacterium]|jgi:hypothetical protein|nr:MAG: hypothetical protein KatS3mg108_1455 [Isosphaeraceae bacterium]